MPDYNLEALILYWLMISAFVGCSVTPLIYDRKGRNPWLGAVTGLIVGIISGQIFGRLLLTFSDSVLPSLSAWISRFGRQPGSPAWSPTAIATAET